MLTNTETCVRTDTKNDPGAQFSKGAMETLAAHGTVIATFIDAPDIKPIGSSSEVCRFPIGVPPIDIENVMKEYMLKDENENEYHPFHFPFDKKTLYRDEKRLLATLKFKLAVKLTSLTMPNVHDPNDEFKSFCKQFKEAVDQTKNNNKPDPKEILVACSEKCIVVYYNSVTKFSDKAVDFFLGIPDVDYDKLTKKKITGLKLLVLDEKIWTVKFEQLLFLQPVISKKITKDKAYIYRQGQVAMKQISKHTTDYLSNTPLEIAYRWSLPVQSFKYNDSINFNENDFKIAFKDTCIGRIFDGNEAIQINDALIKKKVKPNIF